MRPVRIAYLGSRYNWASFSVVRSIRERLPHFATVIDCLHTDDFDRMDVDQVWNIGSVIPVPKTKKPVILWGLSDPMRYFPQRAEMATIYATSYLNLVGEHPNSLYLPPFADIRHFKPLDVRGTTAPCVFMGVGAHPHMRRRIEMVDELRAAGVKVTTFGKKWPAHPDSRKFLTGAALVRAYTQAHLALDLSGEGTSVSSRLFQAGMCGTPTLTVRRPDVEGLLDDEKEALYYGNDFELVGKAHHYLRQPDLLREMGAAARQRCLAEHDVDHRLQTLLAHAEKVLG